MGCGGIARSTFRLIQAPAAQVPDRKKTETTIFRSNPVNPESESFITLAIVK